MTFRLAPRALAYVQDVAAWIAADNPHAAQTWVLAISSRFQLIGDVPGVGGRRAGLPPGVLVFRHKDHLIFHRRKRGGAIILRVLHGARDWRRLV